jgi:hypothetical protein
MIANHKTSFPPHALRASAAGAGTVLAAAAAGYFAATSFVAALAVVCLPFGLLVLQSRLVRSVVFLSGIFAFQSSQSVTLPKLLYLSLVGAAAAAAFAEITRSTREEELRSPLLMMTGSAIAATGVAAIVGRVEGNPGSLIFRDASAYILLAIAPLIAYDLAHSCSRRQLLALALTVFVVGAISYNIEWLSNRRGLAQYSVSRLALPSFMLLTALVALGVAGVREKGLRPGLWWAAIAAVGAALALSTGSRSALALIAVPAVTFIDRRGWSLRLMARQTVRLVAILLLGLSFISVFADVTGARLDRVRARFRTIPEIVRGDSRDQSVAARQIQVHESLERFTASPLLGLGFGHQFRYVTPSGESGEAISPDTGLAFVAKFGLLGIAVLVLWTRAARRLARVKSSRGFERLALKGFAAGAIAWSLSFVPFEDKGFAFALALLLALLLQPFEERGRQGLWGP